MSDTEKQHVLCAVIEFDNGYMAEKILHTGTFEECKNAAEGITGISCPAGYNHKIVNSYIGIREATDEPATTH